MMHLLDSIAKKSHLSGLSDSLDPTCSTDSIGSIEERNTGNNLCSNLTTNTAFASMFSRKNEAGKHTLAVR
jgi:hypothetical protein